MASVVGLLILASAFFSHSFPMGGAEGWTLLDLVLPATLSVYAVLAIVHRTLSQRLRRVSLLPAALFFLMSLHIFTDPRIGDILAQLSATRLPTGGFRLYYSIAISVLLYYTVPLVVSDEAKLRKFLRIYLGVILFQVLFTYVRVALHIDELPWDSYSSKIMQYREDEYWGAGVRLIALGDVAMHLFIFALIFMQRSTRWRMTFLILGMVSIIYSKGRAPMLSCLLVVFLYMVLERRLWLPAFVFAAVVGSVLIFFAMTPSALEGLPVMPKRFLSVLSPENPEYKTETFSRMRLWKVQWYMIQRNPFWGTMKDFPPTAEEDTEIAVLHGDTHGVYLGMAALFGIPTLLVWLTLVLRQMLRCYDLWRGNARDSEVHRVGLWLLLLYCAYLFKYLTSGSAGGGYEDFFVLFALVDVAHKLMRREPAPERAAPPRAQAALVPARLHRTRPHTGA